MGGEGRRVEEEVQWMSGENLDWEIGQRFSENFLDHPQSAHLLLPLCRISASSMAGGPEEER
jgi:hypothetical protein